MKASRLIWLIAATATAGFMAGCSSDNPPKECDDLNGNGLCDTEEPGHGKCPVADRDAQGKCPDAPPHCTGIQILVDNVCEDCPAGDIAQNNVCVTPSVTCGANEIIVNGACQDCGSNATATANECVPHCDADQILVDNACVDCDAGQVNDGSNVCVPEDPGPGCDAGEILVNDACCADANENGLCDDNEPGEGACPVEERDADGNCPTVCDPTLQNGDGICSCADLDLDALCDSDPADDCFGADNGNDADDDGFCTDTDCDDADAWVFPGAEEHCGQQIVNDCENPCWDTACDAADLASAKDGLATEVTFGNGGAIWTNVTESIVGSGKVFEADGASSLYFCGVGPFEVDLRVSGQGANLTVQSGTTNVMSELTAAGQDRPVLTVKDNAYVTVSRLALTHEQGFSGQNGHGILCSQATFGIFNGFIRNNAAQKGGGIFSEGCEVMLDGEVFVGNNHAEQGAAMFFTGVSTSMTKGGDYSITGNVTEDDSSAALHVEDKSEILWNLGPDAPKANFRANRNLASLSRDIVVQSDAKFGIRVANFFSPAADHVRTEANTYTYGTGVDLSCDATICSP